MLPFIPLVSGLFSAVGTGVTAVATTTAATAASTAGTLSLAAAVGAGYALGSSSGGGSRRPREQQGAGVDREALRRELEAAYAKGYEEAQRDVMDELKAMEYERGRKSAYSL